MLQRFFSRAGISIEPDPKRAEAQWGQETDFTIYAEIQPSLPGLVQSRNDDPTLKGFERLDEN